MKMILQTIQQVLGIVLFWTPGILLSYIIFSKTDIIKRAIYSIVLAVSNSVILGVVLYRLNMLTSIYAILSLFSLSLFLFVILKSRSKQCKTYFIKDIWYLIFFSLSGTFWRLGFLKSIKNFSAAYDFGSKFNGEAVPNLGFYKGISIDRSRFIGSYVFYKISEFLSINKITNKFFDIFLITFLFLGFIYLIFSLYRNKKIAYLGIALMALGPFEIFHTTLDFFGHSFSYIALFSLFLLYKSNYREDFQIALTLSLVMMFTYFTSAIINALASIGFIIALFIKEFSKVKNIKKSVIYSFKNMKVLSFILIGIASLTFVFGFSSFLKNSSSSNIGLITAHITTYPILKYKDHSFLGLSAIRWQMLFFFLCGLTFIFYIVRKKDFSEENLDLLLCLIPILLVSCAFYYVNLPTRIFDYFGFFGLLVLKIPKKYFKLFFISSFIFILITGFYTAKDKKVFFETPDKEIKGAKEISNSLKGKIFSDMFFINQLISNGYYDVTGANDDDPLIYKLFYQNNPAIFLNGVNYLKNNLDIEYIAITKRMQKKYILMLNVPQMPLINIELYEKSLIKVYDNSDVKVFKTELKDKK